MHVEETSLSGVLVIQPAVFRDDRGSFSESWEQDRYAAFGLPASWRQDNVVHSVQGVLRGLHFQYPRGQHKLVSVIVGEIFDVAVDIRRESPTFGKWTGVVLSAENRRQLSVPPGFAHGYQVLSERSIVSYKCSERFDPACERSIRWDDEQIAVEWPMTPTLISPKDLAAGRLADIARDLLPPL